MWKSVFKPFIFVPQIAPFVRTASPLFGADDPVKQKPRFQKKPDRSHELYKKHKDALVSMKTSQVQYNRSKGDVMIYAL
ncbi:unnamed protein product [Ranitomeya imitator]|uniref:Uncharacterized protein n=1 Tax=Ranitomeya imitator TaxID=111125 RepID=A0ABN9ML19_9NEOB|nr:unnamed protein product [Ranitomeya imitator]